MNSTILAVRAVTAVYARQLLWPLLWIGLGVYAVVLAIVIWIAYAVSPWWMLLAILPTILIIVGLLIWIIIWGLTKSLEPDMNKEKRVATKKFVGHIGRVAEHVGTPKFVIFYRVLKDIVARPEKGETFIGEIAQTPGEMRRDFETLRKLFS
jgi:hypothetical protein